jgi:hypothetical protein
LGIPWDDAVGIQSKGKAVAMSGTPHVPLTVNCWATDYLAQSLLL